MPLGVLQKGVVTDHNRSMESYGPRFTDTLHVIRDHAAGDGELTLRELVELVGPKGHVFLALFLVLPFLQPIPLPGISTLFGLAIAVVGALMALDKPPWLPRRLGNVRIKRATLMRICEGLEKIMGQLEKIVRPRGRALFSLLWFRRLVGLTLILHSLILSLPLPIPFSNFLPALVLFLVSLGTLEEDAAVLLGSAVAVTLNAAYFAALVLLPYFGIQWLQN